MKRILTSWMLICALAGLLPGMLQAAQLHVHGTAGFSAPLPEDWTMQRFQGGLELTKDGKKLAIENLDIADSTPDEVLSALTAPAGNWRPTIAKRSAINKPYAGVRATLRSGNADREIALLQTPIGFFMVSLEPYAEADRAVFDNVLSGFAALDAAHLGPAGGLQQFVRLGSYELAMPAGEVKRSESGLIWKSPAHGMLTVELLPHGKSQPLTTHLQAWEKAMANAKSPLVPAGSARSMVLQNRPAIMADYSGRNTIARVLLQELDAASVLQMVLIARKETFASQQALIDAVGFSVMPSGLPGVTSSAPGKPPARKKAVSTPQKPPTPAAPAAPPKSEPAQQTKPAEPPPAEEAKSEKSFWERLSESVKKGGGQSECSDAQRSLNQCR